jgi:peptidoglycan hydrolase-like protein with peptidoglycan-binding domain
MRYCGAILLSLVCSTAAFAQAAPQPKPKAAAPKANPIADSYKALSDTERAGIQQDLIWSGDYNGTAGTDFGERAIAAVKTFQKARGYKETGVLNPQERAVLSAVSKKKQAAVGWRVQNDPATGARLGIPDKLAPQAGKAEAGSRWASARGEVQIETFKAAAGTTLQAAYEREQKGPGGRKVNYNVLRPDFFVVSGLQGLKKFYVRASTRDGEVRGFTVMYDQAVEGTLDPVAIAMSSAFAPFPNAAIAAPPPRRKVEYGTGIVIDDAGGVVTTRELLEGCQVITLAALGPADKVAEDRAANLALLRVYGARGLAPAALADIAKDGEVTLAGVADPQAQGGGSAVSTPKARIGAPQSEQRSVEPSPPLGFQGAGAFSGPPSSNTAKLIGLVALKETVVASTTPVVAQATLIPAETIGKFLAAQQIAPNTAPAGMDAQTSVVRVICVRK